MFMPSSIRVLIVEDRPADAELIIRELRQAGFEPDWQRVETEEDYLAQLASRPDIILADHNLPQFSAPRALALLQERGLDIPFVIITGSISEEVAVERMKQGATDYLLKDRLTRLGQAVEHALKEKLLRQEKRAAQEALLQLAAIVESSDDAIIGTALDGTIFSWNSAAKRFYGYTAEEAKGRHISLIAPPDRVDEVTQIRERLTRGELVPHFETVRMRKDGEPVHVSVTVSPIKDAEGKIIGASAIARDLTERKRAEEVLSRLPLEEIGRKKSRARRDLAIILPLGILMFFLSFYFDVFETVSERVLKYKETGIDELISLLVFLAFAFAFFSYRRWQEVKEEIVRRKKAEEALHTLQADLERRVQERTVDLARSNESLRAEVAQRKRAEEARQARHQELQALYEIGQNVLQSQDLKSLLEGILARLFTIGTFDLGMIRLLDTSNKMLKPMVSRGYRNPGEIKSHSIRPEDPTAGRFQIDAFTGFRVNVTEDVPATPGLRTLKREGVRAAILIPLRAENQALGTILLASRAPRKFKAEEIHLLEAIGNQVSVAIQKAQLQAETQQNLERIRALHEIDLAITSTLNLRTTLDILLERTDRLLPFVTATTVRLLNRETGELEPVACRNLDEEEWKVATAAATASGLGRMLPEKNTPVMVLNVQTDPRSLAPEFLRKYGLVSSLRVPLVVKDDVLGVLAFFTKEEHQFTDEEVEFLTTLASQAAIAINNAQLYEKIDLSRKELELTNQYLEKSLKELSGLYTALTPLTPSESVHEMMDGIIERLVEATGADAALIRLKDKEKGGFYWASQRGFPESYLKAAASPPPGSALEQVFNSGEPIIASDIASDSRLKGKNQLKVGLRSCAMLPLKVQQEVRGIVHLASRKPGYFDEEQKDHLMAIARQMDIALENKDLFDNLRSSRDDLGKANKIKDEFLSVMSHELRTPLNVVVGYTGMIMDGLLGEVNDKQKEAMEKVIRRTNDQLALVNNILYATVLESETVVVDTQDFNLEDFLNQLSLGYDAPINKEISLNWDYASGLPVIRTDSAKLKHILQNLIDNALKFTGKGSVTVSARIKQATDNQLRNSNFEIRNQSLTPSASGLSSDASRLPPHAFVEFKVADTGVGILKEHLPIVFEKFRQVDSSETRLYGGVGIGLYIVKKFAELLGGTIDVESEAGVGSTFTVTLPLSAVPDDSQADQVHRLHAREKGEGL